MISFLMLNAFAHKPSFGPNNSITSAFMVEDPNISIVVYQDMTCESEQLWLSFTAQQGFEMYIQAGVPEIDRLELYTPKLAVLAPGLPLATEEVPFDIPDGMGIQMYEAQDIPSEFYEPFTQTSSWVWVEEWLELPENGAGYVVGWNEVGETGKLWIATGEVEDFSDVEVSEFIIWNEYVNNFHETGRFESVIPKEEKSCINEEDEEFISKDGCNQGSAFLFILPLFGFRAKNSRFSRKL